MFAPAAAGTLNLTARFSSSQPGGSGSLPQAGQARRRLCVRTPNAGPPLAFKAAALGSNKALSTGVLSVPPLKA